MEANFKFEIDQKVETAFGDVGIVNMAAIDDNRQECYFIKRSDESKWFKVLELKAV